MGLEAGQHVKFYGTHDKSNRLTGTIVRVHEDSDLVDISVEPDGKVIEVATILSAHSSDVTLYVEEPDPFIGTTEAVHDDFQESTRSRRKSRG